MFELLFTDSDFIRRFMNVRKMTSKRFFFFFILFIPKTCCIGPGQSRLPCVSPDGSFTAWQKDASGNMKRNLNYTITISNPLIGKFSTATENQVRLL